MIKYSLNCGDCTNTFEGWFPDSKDFSKQKKTGQLLCPFCDSGNVDKAIMAPNIQKKQTQKKNKVNIKGKKRAKRSYIKPEVKKEICQYIESKIKNMGPDATFNDSQQNAVIRPQSICFKTLDNAHAYGFFYAAKKKNESLPPLLVLCHGGPTAATSPQWDPMVQFWVQQGISVVDVNYRGSTGYGLSLIHI